MTERPIIFSGESVRSILSGRKTMTRRLVKLREFQPSQTNGYDFTFRDRQMRWHDVSTERLLEKRAPYRAGDRLWVKEKFCYRINLETCRFLEDTIAGPTAYWYYAEPSHDPQAVDGDGFQRWRRDGWEASPWVSPIRMPRRASRLTLEVLSVRAERLQEITEEDALAEGMPHSDGKPGPYGVATELRVYPVKEFRHYWYRTDEKKAPWDSNPFVWVVSFRRVDS